MRRYNANCHVLLIDMSNKRFHVTRYTGLKTVSLIAQKYHATIVVNGDGWGTVGYPNSIAASDGKVYQTKQFDFRPWINISKDNKVSFDSNYRIWKRKLYNTVSGDRYIITKNGKYEERIRDFNKEPRTAVGLTRDDRLILIVADGRTEESQGLSFRELGYIFEEFGAITAINLDGGGSSALWVKDRILNVPIEDGVPGKERAVANHLCVFIE
jgi:exopolysaccharide biosynthesis protein